MEFSECPSGREESRTNLCSEAEVTATSIELVLVHLVEGC